MTCSFSEYRSVVSHNARLVFKWLVLLAALRSVMKEIYLSMFVLSGTWKCGFPNSMPLVVILLPKQIVRFE